jgi:hypothetical protein
MGLHDLHGGDQAPGVVEGGAAWVGMTDLESLHDEGLAYLQYYLCEQMGIEQKVSSCGETAPPSTSLINCKLSC